MYQPNWVKRNKPITIGHAYSSVVLLPEAAYAPGPAWGVPVGVHRVKSSADKERVGALQIEALLDDKELPCYAQLCVQDEDSGYSKPAFLAKNRAKTNRVTITRARTNRTFDRPPAQTARAGGPPTWYGAPWALPDPTTGPTSDATATTAMRRLRGQTYQVQLEAWPNMRLPGKCKPAPLPMRLYPFTLVRLRLLNAPGELAFQRPLWRMGMGERRRELSVLDSFQADQRRYDMEHFFRFGKQRLLLDRYPTPDAEHQEQWWRLVHLAYRQLGVARDMPRKI